MIPLSIAPARHWAASAALSSERGATRGSAMYELGELDVGHTVTVRVIGTRDGYREHIVGSAPTDPVFVRERGR